jgi:hypothetical protein
MLETGYTLNNLFEIHNFKCFGANWNTTPAASILVVLCAVRLWMFFCFAGRHGLTGSHIRCGCFVMIERLYLSTVSVWLPPKRLSDLWLYLCSCLTKMDSPLSRTDFIHTALIWFSTRVSLFCISNGSVPSLIQRAISVNKYSGVIINLRVFCKTGMNCSTVTD